SGAGRRPAVMKRSNVLRLAILAWTTLVWVLLWGTFSIANILGGIAVSLIIMFVLPLPRVPVEGRLHLLSAARLGGVIFVETIRSTINVAWLAIRPAPPPVTGVLRVRLSIKSDLVLTLWTDIM